MPRRPAAILIPDNTVQPNPLAIRHLPTMTMAMGATVDLNSRRQYKPVENTILMTDCITAQITAVIEQAAERHSWKDCLCINIFYTRFVPMYRLSPTCMFEYERMLRCDLPAPPWLLVVEWPSNWNRDRRGSADSRRIFVTRKATTTVFPSIPSISTPNGQTTTWKPLHYV
jgi:hypothetical protein